MHISVNLVALSIWKAWYPIAQQPFYGLVTDSNNFQEACDILFEFDKDGDIACAQIKEQTYTVLAITPAYKEYTEQNISAITVWLKV